MLPLLAIASSYLLESGIVHEVSAFVAEDESVVRLDSYPRTSAPHTLSLQCILTKAMVFMVPLTRRADIWALQTQIRGLQGEAWPAWRLMYSVCDSILLIQGIYEPRVSIYRLLPRVL